MIESGYTQAIHKRLPPDIYRWKINDNFEGGVPDAYYRTKDSPGTDLWVEYKFLKSLPKRDSSMVVPKLSAQQLLWLQNCYKAGRPCWVIIGVEDVKFERQSCGIILENPEQWVNGVSVDVARMLLNSNNYKAVAQKIADRVRHVCK